MHQDTLILLLLKIVLVSGAVSVAVFVVQYHRLARWWTSPIGRTIVIKDLLLVFCLMPSILSLFFHLSAFTSRVAAWADIVLFGLLTPVMIWRVAVFQRISSGRSRKQNGTRTLAPVADPGGGPQEEQEEAP